MKVEVKFVAMQSMRRPAFKIDPSHKNKTRDNEKESRLNKEISEDFMPSTLRKMLSMKNGKRKEPAEGASGSKMTMDHSNGSGAALHDKQIRTHDSVKKENSNQIDKKVSSKQNEAKRKKKEFLKAKEKKKKLKKNSSHGKIKNVADEVVFGEQAEQPLESSLKRKHWAEASNTKTVGIKPRSVPKLDSKMLAAFYKTSGGSGKAGGSRATMQSLKALLRQKEGESYA